jgi:uncharacterized protein (DUF1800 family)
MPEANDTESVVESETLAPEVNGTDVDESTATPATQREEVDYKALAEAKEKELNQARMELNQRRNKEKELEAAQAKAARERIEKESDAAVQAEFYRKQLEEREAADAQREADAEAERQAREVDEFRDKIIADYPPSVQDLAKKLGTNWDDASTFDIAETQLRSKLDLLKASVVAPEAEEEAPEINSNNPRPEADLTEIEKLGRLSAKEMRKLLPVAAPR